ncbi:MAG: hypothetical protein M3070_17365, partial [Actinomycetota bacterium]|nr:hypothetical protein [Actinomycetota bacterium]
GPGGADLELRVAVLAALAGATMMSGQAELALRTAEEAIALAQSVGARHDELHATITTGCSWPSTST